jgi:hypothetical protein
MEIYTEFKKFYIRRKRGYSGRKYPASWYEWFTLSGEWSKEKGDAAEFSNLEEAEINTPKIVKQIKDY